MEGKKLFADLLSLLAMSYAKEDVRECLTFKLQGDADIAQWGHEYIRCATLVSKFGSYTLGSLL